MTTIQTAIDAFLLDAEARGLRPASLTTYGAQLKAFRIFASDESVSQLDQVDAGLLRKYLVYLKTNGLRASSIQSHGKILKVWLNFCARDGMVAQNPARNVKPPRQKRPEPNAFTKAEIAKLLETTRNLRDRAIILCLLDTGCRIGEFTAWQREHVDLAEGIVTIPAENAKTHQKRVVFLGEHTRRTLALYMTQFDDGQSAIWRTRTGEPLTFDGMKRAINRIGERSGISPHGAQRYRRTALTFMLRDGMDIYSVADLAGHSTIDLLKHYIADSDTSALKAAHAKHGAVDQLLK